MNKFVKLGFAFALIGLINQNSFAEENFSEDVYTAQDSDSNQQIVFDIVTQNSVSPDSQALNSQTLFPNSPRCTRGGIETICPVWCHKILDDSSYKLDANGSINTFKKLQCNQQGGHWEVTRQSDYSELGWQGTYRWTCQASYRNTCIK